VNEWVVKFEKVTKRKPLKSEFEKSHAIIHNLQQHVVYDNSMVIFWIINKKLDNLFSNITYQSNT
jgi:hypothetical protein